jgi:hypothetical protein
MYQVWSNPLKDVDSRMIDSHIIGFIFSLSTGMSSKFFSTFSHGTYPISDLFQYLVVECYLLLSVKYNYAMYI